jgi:L-ribulose-5-phosphate 3-epimerase UlaE
MAEKSTADLRAELDALRTRLSSLIDIVEIKLDALDERERRLKELQEQMTQAAQAAKEKVRIHSGTLSARGFN